MGLEFEYLPDKGCLYVYLPGLLEVGAKSGMDAVTEGLLRSSITFMCECATLGEQ